MKLTKIAGAVVAVIGAVAVGGSWYTGKQVEEKYQQLVEQTNSQLAQFSKQYGVKMAIKEVQIDRHFFSSDAKYRFEVEMDDGEKLDFVGNDKINHGPLPLNRLAKFNLAPVLMSVENHIQAPEQFKEVMGEQLGSGLLNMSYAGSSDGEFTVSPIKFKEDGEHGVIDISPIKVTFSTEKDLKNAQSTVHLDNFKLTAEDVNAELKGLSYSMKAADEQGYPHLGLGSYTSTVESIEVKLKDGLGSHFKNIKFNGENTLKGERVVSTGTVEIASLSGEGLELGNVKADLTTDFDAKLMNEIMPLLSDPQEMENSNTGDLMLQLLSKSAKLHLNNLSFERDNGKLDLALILNLAQFEPQNISNFNGVINALSQSKFTLNINRDYMEETVRQVAIIKEKLSEDEAKTKAKQEVDMVLANAGTTGFAVADGNNLKSELIIENGKMRLNGRELTEDEIQMAFFMIMMGAGGLGK